MIRLSVLYPKTEGATFDHDYYLNKHIPMACRMWGLTQVEVDRGIRGPYVAAAHFRFDSMDALSTAMKADSTAIASDLSNYTTITPVMQISQIDGDD
ncbi:EthD family reductase [Parafrankia sp. EUN1f]|uniref:EthD family reductase n=1 Tax=Parafrankia sp. EUN1f TaxID=102897 RepID=UPI0001C46FED|nr:EthD family reductase [Parafrankia sp. EUN1f]EFC82600.1 Ethyl tert-butyl ether degradation EthD [Parafrankia sp. EUN1f]